MGKKTGQSKKNETRRKRNQRGVCEKGSFVRESKSFSGENQRTSKTLEK